MITGDFKNTELNITVVINVVRVINLLVLIKNEWMDWERAKVGWAGILRVRGRLYNKPTAKFPDVTVNSYQTPTTSHANRRKNISKSHTKDKTFITHFSTHIKPSQLKKQKKLLLLFIKAHNSIFFIKNALISYIIIIFQDNI